MVKTPKYIYHSEKTKTTCEDCKKHDNEIYYDIKDIPKLPIHPNCKCWIEAIELNISNNSKCDCADKFIVLENNLINSIKNTETMLNNIKDNIIEIEKEINNKENDKDKTNVIHEFYLIKNKTENFKKECESLLTDIGITKEFTFDNTFHTIEQCKSNKELNKHSKNVSRLCKKQLWPRYIRNVGYGA